MVVSSTISIEQLQEFQKSSWRLIFKRQVKLVKDGVINHIVTTTFSEWQVIMNAW
jgi:hypothetical protein